VIRTVGRVLFVAGALGAVALGLMSSNGRFWPAFLVNLLFWSGISLSGVVFSAVVEMTNARWGRPFKRIAEATSSFLPVSFLLFVVLIVFGAQTLGWNAGEIKRIWLSMPFLAVRDVFGLLLLYSVSLYYVYVSLRPDLGKLSEEGRIFGEVVKRFLIAGWEGTEREVQRKHGAIKIFAPVVIVLYCVIETFIGIDFVMALDPEWFSTLFGGYFFMGNLYLGLAFLALVSLALKKKMGTGTFPRRLHL
jgi:hypothetical protein